MKFNRILAGVLAGTVIFGSIGLYPYSAMDYVIAAETEEKVESTEKEENITAESYLAEGYDAVRATIYSNVTDGSSFNMNGRTYSQGVVFAGQYSYQASTASICYNTEDISSLSWVWGHLDNTSMTGATVSIYLDDVLMDKYTLSSNMLQQEYSVDVSETSVLKISVAFDKDAKFAIADVSVDDIKPAISPKAPEYMSIASFTNSMYNYKNYSTFSAVSDFEAIRINGRYYYQGVIFNGQYSYQASQAIANFNTENVKSISCSWGHIDNSSMTNATVSVYHDNVLTDKFALSATMPITEYSVDVTGTAELRFVIDFEKDAKFAMTDITIDAIKTAKTGKAPTYQTPEMFINDGYNRVNTSYFSAVSDLEAQKINGRYYYQGLLFKGQYSYQASSSVVDFNVENVDSISGTLGHIDNTNWTDAVLSVYKDGVLTEKIKLGWHMLPETVTFDTKDCTNLRLIVEHEKDAQFALAEISVNETKAKKSFTIPEYKDSKAFISSGFDIYEARAFDFVSDLDAYSVNGEKCYSGIVFNGKYSYQDSMSYMTFNTENVDTLIWTWGHKDESPLQNAKAEIYVDNVLVEEIELTSGMAPVKQTIDVSDASKIRVIVYNDRNASYILKDIELSDETVNTTTTTTTTTPTVTTTTTTTTAKATTTSSTTTTAKATTTTAKTTTTVSATTTAKTTTAPTTTTTAKDTTTASATTTAKVTTTPTVTTTPVVTSLTIGDIDNNKSINANDASMILAEYAIIATNGTPNFTEEQMKAADVNDDGEVNAIDASLVLAYYAHISTGGTLSLKDFISDKV